MVEALRGPLAGVAAAFDVLEPDMRWVQTEGYREKLGEQYMANYAYTNLVGWKGLVPHERVAAGIFIIGPGCHYPDHHHAAEEIYFPFGGDTLWSQAGRPATPRAPGSSIHNPPWQRHEMTTVETPLFVLYCWRGAVLENATLIPA
jgi:quercetin dioxygenase-like cupin family protein